MACLPITCPLPLLRGQSNFGPVLSGPNIVQFKDLRLQKLCVRAVSKKKSSQVEGEDVANEESFDESPKKTRRAPRRTRKKVTAEVPEEDSVAMASKSHKEESTATLSAEDSKKVTRRGLKKATASESSKEGESTEKKVPKRRTRRKIAITEDQSMASDFSGIEESVSLWANKNENEELQRLQLREDDGEDISYTYSWPPLVCCFGAAQHAFIPSGRPANRLIDHEIHESKKDMFWSPTKFVRAPGSSASSVAVAHASIGGRVAFMGKVGDDEYGDNMIYYLNVNKVQTRSIMIDNSRPTATSYMKIIRRGGLKMNCVKPCAEDSLLSSEINIDILKEAKMFYFNSSSLLDQNMRRTTMQAIEISKKLGGVIFFDLNLPLPLWNSGEETRTFIQQAWESADVIEVTKQELEFLSGIDPVEKFDTKDNDKSKFIHYKPEVVMPLWHKNLKVLFLTNGSSKIHYYTEKDNGWVHGMEDAPITPFTGDMSISGDAIVAALMRMLTVQPHLATDKGYLEHMIKYAIDCGVIDQWSLARVHGFPTKDDMDPAAASSELGTLRSITEREYRTV